MVARRGLGRLGLALVFVVAAFAALFVTTFGFASAHTHEGGRTVFFQDETIGDEEVVHGDIDILLGSVTCEDGGEIDGNVHTYFGKFEPLDGCTVNGTVSSAFASEPFATFAPFGMSPDDFRNQNESVLKKLAWDVVVGLAFLLFPLRVRVALDRVEAHPGLSFATGTLAIVAALPIAIVLLISVIGLPLIPLEFAALFAGLWIGNAAVALLIGRRLYELLRPQMTPSPLGALGLGLIVTTAAESLPVLGWAVSALVILVGLGAALLAFVRETSFRSFTGGAPLPPGGTPPGPSAPMKRPA